MRQRVPKIFSLNQLSGSLEFAMLHSLCSGLTGLLVVSVLVGCGSKGDGYSGPRGSVAGTITIDGSPLKSGCQVVFVSDKGYMASGPVGEGGTYKLSYPHGGIPAVEYKVQLSAPAVSAPAQPVDPTKMAESLKLSKKSGGANEAPFPPKYLSASSSKMSFTVKDGENKADFALSSK